MKTVPLLKIFIFNFSILFTQIAFAQKSDSDNKINGKRQIKDISNSNYTSLKKQGALSENYEYRIDNGKVISFNPAARPYSPTSSTLTPCDIVPVQGSVGYSVQVDDSPLLTIPIPFNFCFYGTNYTSLNLSANGNVQFSSNSTSFSSTGFPSTLVNMIAPFWADGESMLTSGGLTYGKIHIDPHPTYMIISWDSMGYYNNHVDKLNSFQLVLTNGLDPILPAGKNVGFYYKKMQWTTGDASSGTNGFPTTQPGTPATIGANQGNGTDYFLIGRFGVPGSIYDGPLGNSDGVSWLDGKRFFFDVCPPVGSNQAPIPTLIGPCDTIKLCGNDSLIIKNAFIGPELTQTVSVTASASTLGSSFTYSVLQTGNNTDISMFVDGSTAPAGYHIVTITATDNGVPALTSSQNFVVFVDHATVNNLNGHIVFTPTIGVCPGGSTTASVVVTGGTPSSYLWNNNASSTSTGFTVTPALDSTVYVTIKSGQCQKTLKNYIHVNPVPVASITGNTSLCTGTGSTTVLTASNTLNFAAQAPYTYSWAGPPATTSQTITATGGSYSVIITNKYNCTSAAAITVTLNTSPVFTVVPSNTVICPGTSVPLNINIGSFPPSSCGLASSGCASSTIRTVGAGFQVNSSTGSPTPYSNYWCNSHVQMLYLASELSAAGVVAGKLSSIGFKVNSLNSFSTALPNYTIKLKCTSATSLTSTFDNAGLFQVFNGTYMPTTGINTHNFSQAYEWDGVSNILVDICYDRIPAFISSGAASVIYVTTAYTSVRYENSDSQNLCGSTGVATTSSLRANTYFGNCSSTSVPSAFTYSWSPITGLSNPNISNPVANPTTSIIYSVVVTPTIASNCSSTRTSTITVNIPTTPTISSVSAVCSNAASFTLSALPAGGTWSLTTPTSTSGVFTPSLAAIGNNTVTYTYGGVGCAQTTTAIVTVERFVPSTITGTINPICLPSPPINLATALTTSTLGTGVWTGNGVTGTTFDPAVAGAGTHILMYSTNSSPTASLCPSSSTIAVNVNSVAQPTIASAGPFCTNASTIALTGTPAGGTWLGTGISSSGVLTPSIATVGNNTYTYTVGSATCSAVNMTTISIEQYVPSTITGTINPICLPSPPINLATALTTSTLGTGVWTGSGVTGTTFDPAVAGAGTHILMYSTNSSPTASLCPSSSTIAVNVNSVAQPTITQAGPFCTNASTLALIGTPTGGTWLGTGISSGGVLTPSIATVGNNTYSYTVGSATCSAVSTTTISIEQYVPSTITGTINPICLPSPTVDLATALTTSTLGTGVWTGNGVTGTTFDPAIAGAGTHTLTYSTNSNPTASLCPSFSVITVNVNSVAQPTITQAGPFCTNASTLALTGTPAGGTWVGTGVSSGGVLTPSLAVVGNNTYSYTVGSATCSAVNSTTISIEQYVPSTITGTINTLCVSSSTIDLATALTTSTLGTGVWTGNGVTGTTFDPAIAGAGTHTLTYSTNSSPTATLCPSFSVIAVTVNSVVQPTITPIGPFCDNYSPQQMTVTPTGGVWSASAGSSVTPNGLFIPSPILVGSNKLYYTLTNAPCVKTDSIIVDVIHFVPATITGALGPYCIYDPTVSLLGITQFTGGVWSGSGVSTGSFTPSVAGAGPHVITYITNPSPLLNCGETKTTSILVNSKPVANAIPSNSGGCNYPWVVDFSTTTVNTGIATWSFGDGSPNGHGLMVSHTYTTPGTYMATITYTDNAGCKDTTQISNPIIIFPIPDAAFEPSLDVTTVIDAEIVFTNQTTNLLSNSYLWDFGGLGGSADVSPTYLFVNSGEYFITLVAVSPDGCQDTAVKKITINPDVVLYVPNAFTPGNNDGLNDVFQIFLPSTGVDYSSFSLSIYDRWGELVYKTNDVNESWTGAKNNSGTVLKQDVYIWKINFQDMKKKYYSRMGHVSLLHK